jgi:hypothetical protein
MWHRQLLSLPAFITIDHRAQAGPHSRAAFAREWGEECLCHTSEMAIQTGIGSGFQLAAPGREYPGVVTPKQCENSSSRWTIAEG